MLPLIILGVLALLPIVAGLVLRVNVTYLFSALLSGSVLLKFLGDDIALATNAFIRGAEGPLYVQLAILLLPVVLTIVLLKGTVSAAKLPIHFIPLLGVGLSTAVLALPLLPSALQASVFATEPGNLLRIAQDDIIGLTILLNLFVMWLGLRKKHDEHHGKHHK